MNRSHLASGAWTRLHSFPDHRTPAFLGIAWPLRRIQAQGLWIYGQFAWRRNGPLAVGNENAVIHRAALCPQIHRPPRARSFFYLGFKVKSSSRRIKPGWPRAFLARAIRNYASDSAPHSPVRLQRRIKSRMSSTRHAVMRAPSVRTGRG